MIGRYLKAKLLAVLVSRFGSHECQAPPIDIDICFNHSESHLHQILS